MLIEFKTGPQNPDFRHALAQLIDYGSDLWQLSRADFDRGVVQRYLTGPHREPKYAAAHDLHSAIPPGCSRGPSRVRAVEGVHLRRADGARQGQP